MMNINIHTCISNTYLVVCAYTVCLVQYLEDNIYRMVLELISFWIIYIIIFTYG